MLSLRRFPHTVYRLRETPGGRNDVGEFVAGTRERAELRASVQPVSNEDVLAIGVGGRLSERIRLFVAPVRRVAIGDSDTFLWVGNRFLWDGQEMQWRRTAGELVLERSPLLAAFEDRAPDRVELSDGREFAVEESRVWPGHHCRAICIRET